MILGSISVALIALAAGMFLLAKATKDNLSLFFKIVAWFIIVSGILNLGCIAIHTSVRFYGRQSFMYGPAMMHREMPGGMGHGMMKEGARDDMDGCCEGECRYAHGDRYDGYMKRGSCDDGCRKTGGDNCCKMGGTGMSGMGMGKGMMMGQPKDSGKGMMMGR